MIAQQYKNIIEWTLSLNNSLSDSDSLTVARKIFDNLGVALPQGRLEDIVTILNTKKYMGWTPCTKDDAQKFADAGVAAIAIDTSKIIVISPDEKTGNFSHTPKMSGSENIHIKHTTKLSNDEGDSMLFFSYSYGHPVPSK